MENLFGGTIEKLVCNIVSYATAFFAAIAKLPFVIYAKIMVEITEIDGT